MWFSVANVTVIVHYKSTTAKWPKKKNKNLNDSDNVR